MAYRLTGTLDGRPLDLPLTRQQTVVGSGEDCDLRVDHQSVSRRHARLVLGDEQVMVIDLDSSNGTYVDSRRVSSARVRTGSVLAFGNVHLRLEATADADLEMGRSIAPAAQQSERTDKRQTTLGLKPVDVFTTQRLPRLLEMVARGDSPVRVAQAVGAALAETLPAISVRIGSNGDPETALLFEASRDYDIPGRVEPVVVRKASVDVTVQFPHPQMSQAYEPLVETASLLVAMATGRMEPMERGREHLPPSLPEPETVDLTVRRLYSEAAAVARGDVGILIAGESGTGKEVLARYVHDASPRARGPFVPLNCAALPKDLLEAELFGIEQRVATGVDERPGKFEMADGGTLFLDEIGDMDLGTQASILRVLQESEVYRLGGTRPRRADVRIVAATNRNVDDLLVEGRFREDLYYRIATWVAEVPPLRHRPSDVMNLAVFFLDAAARRAGARIAGISQAAVEVLLKYRWPGNVRQLQKEMARAALFVADGGLLSTSHLLPKIVEEATGVSSAPLRKRLDDFERGEIEQALQVANNDVSGAAVALGVGRSTLYRRIRELGIETAAASE